MNSNLGKGGREPSIEWVKEQLRGLMAVKPPVSLRDRLIAGIPLTAGGEPMIHPVRPWSQGIRWGIAAAVVVVGVAVAWLGLPGGRQVRSVVDANGGYSLTYASDHNGLRVSDTNLCDINSLR